MHAAPDAMSEQADLPSLLLDVCRRYPERVAIEVPPGPGRSQRVTLTYRELYARASAVARAISDDVQPDDVVGILLSRDSPLLYVAEIGVLLAGAAYTCLDPAFPEERLRFLIEDSGARHLLSDAAGCARLTRLGVPADLLDLERLDPAEGAPPPAASPQSLAYVIYTSGTTGVPKGVMIEHGGVVNLIREGVEFLEMSPEDRVAQGSSPVYDSSVEEVWLALAAGGTVVVMDEDAVRLGPDLIGWLQAERITVLCPPPTLLRATGCVDPASALPSLRLLYVGGEALPPDVAARWGEGRRLVNGYGPTECTVTVLRGDVRPGAPITIGRPVRGHRAWVVDDHLEEVADGEAGELVIAGPGVARGYLGRSELTAERFPELSRFGRIYRTGDLVRRDPRSAEFHYLGRIDDQVKIRGHRVELGEVEARIAEVAGVRAAAAKVQERAGEGQLVAFVTADPAAGADLLQRVREHLVAVLPTPMIPSSLGLLDHLPTTTGGKLDRRSLPDLEPGQVPATSRPATPGKQRDWSEQEERIGAQMARALGLARVPLEAHFFDDLGGNSLRAAQLVSLLREHERTAHLAVRDVYERPTVAALAALVPHVERDRTPAAESAEGAAPRPRPWRVTMAQSVWLALELVVGSWVAGALLFLVLPLALGELGLLPTLVALPLALAVGRIVLVPLQLAVVVLAKRVLIGRYRAGREPVWGGFYLRHWLVTHVARLLPWGLVQDTVFQSTFLRALGARIGSRVHLHRGVDLRQGGWDLLEIGDDVTVCQDAALRLVDLESGHLVMAPIELGSGSKVDVRAGVSGGATVGERAALAPLSWLPPRESVPPGECYDGVPAAPAGTAPPPPAVGHGLPPVVHGLPPVVHGLPPVVHGAIVVVARMLRDLVLVVPAFVVLLAALSLAGVDTAAVQSWLGAPIVDLAGLLALLVLVPTSVAATLFGSALFCRLIGAVSPGAVPRYGMAHVRVLLATDAVRSAGEWLSGAMLWPWWLRLAGMRVGARSEVSTIIDVVPSMVTIGEGTFLADGIYLGGPHQHRGVVEIAATSLGSRTFLGNHVVVPAGQRLANDLLVGVCTPTDDHTMREGTSWFGHPAFPLPRRDVVTMDRRLTHEPSPGARIRRFTWEAARMCLPVVPLTLAASWVVALTAAAARTPSVLLWSVALPALTLAVPVALGGILLALKWTLLGRVRPGQHGLWSSWCCRWDFLYVAWGQWCRGSLGRLEGTLLLAPYLRAMGMKIGRRVVLGGGFAQVVDPDMLQLDDDATVAGNFQAHSFEDRVLKIDRVRIGARATVGPGSLLFYGAEVGEDAHLAPHSVVLKHERLRPARRYEGNPTRDLQAST